MKIKFKKSGLWIGLVLAVSVFGIIKAANLANVTNLGAGEFSNSIYFGDAQDINNVTFPTQATSDQFSIKVPFYNGSAISTARGSVITASTTATGFIFYGSMVTLLATTTVLGVSDGVYASGKQGWMTIEGYCSVQTTGTVKIGDILVTTTTATIGFSANSTGTQVVGSGFAKALGVSGVGGVTGGDLIPALCGSW